MNFEDEPKGIRSKIFKDVKTAMEYCDHHRLFYSKKICSVCGNAMRFEVDNTYTNGHRLRCTQIGCRKSETLLGGLNINNPKIALNEYLFIVYSWLEKSYEYKLLKNSESSLNSIKRIKRLLIKSVTSENIENKLKLGEKYPVQVDESIIVRGSLTKSPSQTYDAIKGGTWLVGAIEECTRNLVLEIVPNRKKETFLKFFKDNLIECSKVITDGHPSYPYAVAGINGRHKQVNHQEGFKNSEGYHTNLIEGEWALFKTDIKTRKGVPGFAITGYIQEYLWRRRNLKDHSIDTFKLAFLKLLRLLFKPK